MKAPYIDSPHCNNQASTSQRRSDDLPNLHISLLLCSDQSDEDGGLLKGGVASPLRVDRSKGKDQHHLLDVTTVPKGKSPKWSHDEHVKMIQLRQNGMGWEVMSTCLAALPKDAGTATATISGT